MGSSLSLLHTLLDHMRRLPFTAPHCKNLAEHYAIRRVWWLWPTVSLRVHQWTRLWQGPPALASRSRVQRIKFEHLIKKKSNSFLIYVR